MSCEPDFLVVMGNQTSSTPAAFTIVSADQGHTTITLTWNASPGADRYVVKYGTVSGTYSTIVSTNATSPFEVTGLDIGTDYFFMVSAVNSQGVQDATVEITQESIFYDDFSTLQMGTLWQLSTNPTSYSGAHFSSDPSLPVTSDGDDLIFGETVNPWTGINLESLQDFNMTDSWVSTEISHAPMNDGLRFREGGLWIVNSAGDGWEIFVQNGFIIAGSFLHDYTGDQNPGTTPYDPVNHRFIRIRQESSSNRMYFDTSPDGSTWTVFRFVDCSTIPYTSMHHMLYAYSDNGISGVSGTPLVKFNEIKSNAPLH